MAHQDKSYRVAAIYRAWRQNWLTENAMLERMAEIGARETAEIWLRHGKHAPRRCDFEVRGYMRKRGSEGRFYAHKVTVKAARTPTPEQVIAELVECYEFQGIDTIQQIQPKG